MNCPNCGAALAPSLSPDYYFCTYCGSFHFPKPLSEAVFVVPTSDDNPQATLLCPVCTDPLVEARVDVVTAHYCRRCRGVLVAQAGFVSAMRQLSTDQPPPPYRPRPINADALNRSLRCPLCLRKMDVHPYYGPGNVVIDTCSRCRVIWLDHGELSRIISGFAHEDDG